MNFKHLKLTIVAGFLCVTSLQSIFASNTNINKIVDIFLAVTAENPVPHNHQDVLDQMLQLLKDNPEHASLINKIHALKHAHNKMMKFQNTFEQDTEHYNACALDCLQWVEDHMHLLEATKQVSVTQRITELRERFV